ncbi:polysaccharide deacetylase [Phytohabitans sp. ZYX-F-186]|uniref:Polysaccharide deacetylase n=1 Tax=Phytohabitans maris TaxID=3071409 RepID=A0ABU0ZDR9_9ACTN|nr:polysaccharide deacetylase [Phytohabitans sp. ZYX-F-186]MDQ7905201.1 polysaccharide deacetylase [Phytohabitans sp. ZYX-F-186]
MTAAIWPEGATSCVALAFDLDGPTGAAMLDGSIWRSPRHFALGGYDAYRALPRVLDLLDRFSVPATFFVPARVVEMWPDACRRIVDRGHEAAHHGDQHECYWDLTPDRQREVLTRSQEVFRRQLGAPAVGFRTPSGDWHPGTPRLLLEHGIGYSSSMRDDDRPYRHVLDGTVTDLVEIPARVDLDDYAYFAYHRDPDFPRGQDRIASYRSTLDNWRREFDGHHRAGSCLTTIWHPKVSATPGRVIVLERLLEHMTAADGVWFARLRDVAAWWRSRPSPGGPS